MFIEKIQNFVIRSSLNYKISDNLSAIFQVTLIQGEEESNFAKFAKYDRLDIKVSYDF